ncbi:hypothetical protein QNO21_14745 [Microbacterium sp. zg-Y818]|uniref:hypothetical protein n=1 Tax=unclassified Microbacterium TaxID=2609290 RepID=UPI00214B6BC9|nr:MULTISPECIES: hypothetical protein [unclassified Microbacterium]MCR2800384.1 hypothetical protein [Microbacterium sp. zg.Y818]WIM22344.1 hypothetical protein QNO21_14745 [Microbacterium sp. zg-Y818]
MKTTLKSTTLAVLAATLILLAGCAPEATAEAAPAANAEVVEVTEPALPTVEEIAALDNGAPLTEEQAATLKADRKAGMKAYELPTGELVLVKKSEPLPEPVQQAENNKLAAIEVPTGSSWEDQSNTLDKLVSAGSSASMSTGKPTCVIMQVHYAVRGAGGGVALQWAADGCPNNDAAGELMPVSTDKAWVISVAQERINRVENPAEWALIVEP